LTGQDLLNSALRLVGVLASGEIATAAESIDGLQTLNDMLDSWTSDRLSIFTITPRTFALVPGQQGYTIGVGGNFNVPRPPRIDSVSIVSLANPLEPLELPIEMLTIEQWAAIPVKNIQSTLPQSVYDDGAFPLRTLNYYCIPSTTVNTVIYGWAALTSFPTLATNVTFPPGYQRAIRYNLAVELCGEYGRPVDPTVGRIAIESLAKVRAFNAPLVELRCDAALIGSGDANYDWRSDSFGR
jgi:hypothetical protein